MVRKHDLAMRGAEGAGLMVCKLNSAMLGVDGAQA
jgi:hypothetical protein